jgi:hypothetical protein
MMPNDCGVFKLKYFASHDRARDDSIARARIVYPLLRRAIRPQQVANRIRIERVDHCDSVGSKVPLAPTGNCAEKMAPSIWSTAARLG